MIYRCVVVVVTGYSNAILALYGVCSSSECGVVLD
jgi:hypothetical protein